MKKFTDAVCHFLDKTIRLWIVLLPVVILSTYIWGVYGSLIDDMDSFIDYFIPQLIKAALLVLFFYMWKKRPLRWGLLLVLAYYLIIVLFDVTVEESITGTMPWWTWYWMLISVWPALLILFIDAADKAAGKLPVPAGAVFFTEVLLAVVIQVIGRYRSVIPLGDWNNRSEAIEQVVYYMVTADIVWLMNIRNRNLKHVPERHGFISTLVANLIVVISFILPNRRLADIAGNIDNWLIYRKAAAWMNLTGDGETVRSLDIHAWDNIIDGPGVGMLNVRWAYGWIPVIFMSACLLLWIFLLFRWTGGNGAGSRFIRSLAVCCLVRFVLTAGLDMLAVVGQIDAFPLTGVFSFEIVIPFLCVLNYKEDASISN